jgi:flagellar hook assembly protein FlgD
MHFPYTLVVEAFNEAGEKVKLITQTHINKPADTFLTMVNGAEATVFNPSDPGGNLQLRFPGIWTEDMINVDYVDFAWNGNTNSGQEAGQGIYYIKIQVQDEYGHTETIVKEVQLVRTEEYTRVTIYNGAGEIVSRLETPDVSGTVIDLSGLDDVLYVGTGGIVPIKYGSGGQVMNWDGKNLDKKTVSNGTYEIVVEKKTRDGYTVMASKSVTVLSEQAAPVLSDPAGKLYPKMYPNPFVTNGAIMNPVAAIDWYTAASGDITIKIYNVAGELVRRLEGDLSVKPMAWDLKEQNGADVSSGIFVVVMQANADDGRRETAVTKFVVIRAGDNNTVTP